MSRRKEFRVEVKVLSTNLGQVLLNIRLSESQKSLWDSSFLIHRNKAKNIVLHKEPGIKETPKKKLLAYPEMHLISFSSTQNQKCKEPLEEALDSFWVNCLPGGKIGERRDWALAIIYAVDLIGISTVGSIGKLSFQVLHLFCFTWNVILNVIKFSGFKSVLQFIAFLYIHRLCNHHH